jgi:hypothetical protein
VPQFRIGRLGADESSKRAAEWAKENVSATVDAPTIARGSTVIDS